MTDLGTYVEVDGRPAVRFGRTYPHPIERVWGAVTTSEGLAHWFPADVEIDLRPGGVVAYRGDPYSEDRPGRILACNPPSYLAMTWGNDELRFHLESLDDGGTRLTLIDLLDGRNAASRNAAGWHVCLDELDDHFESRKGGHFTRKFDFDFRRSIRESRCQRSTSRFEAHCREFDSIYARCS